MLDRGAGVELILKIEPANSTLVLMGALVAIGPVLFLLTLYFGVSQLYGAIALFGATSIWLSVATIRIKVYPDRLERKLLWRTSWTIKLQDSALREGYGGDVPFIPAIIVRDRTSGQKIGEILKPQFKVRALLALKEVLALSGLEIESRSGKQK